MTEEQQTQGLPQTLQETIPNPEDFRGVVVIYAIDQEINVKARGLTPFQIVRICLKLFIKIFY